MVSERGLGSQALNNGWNGNSSSLRQCVENHQAEDQNNVGPLSTISETHYRSTEITIAVIDGHSFTRETITKSLQDKRELLSIQCFENCDKLLNSALNCDVILYYHHYIVNQRNDILTSSVKKLLPIAPVIVLCDVDSSHSVRTAFDSGARGYIPTVSTNLDVAVEIMYLVKIGGTFVPPSGLSPRAVKPLGTPDPCISQLTPREMAVLDRLKLGMANKIIAYELQITESSVKNHIRSLMRKMNAGNRTEVVCRAHELEVAAMD